MTEPTSLDDDPEIQTQLVLLAAAKHDNEGLRPLLLKLSANVQDPETGFTPLHAAIAACEAEEDVPKRLQNGRDTNEILKDRRPEDRSHGDGSEEEGRNAVEEAAVKTVKLLLDDGAIWNDVDKNNETPGCLALRLGLNKLYETMVNAGVRAELLLNRLNEYNALEDADGEEDEVDGDEANHEFADPAKEPAERSAETVEAVDPEEDPDDSLRNEDYLQSKLHFEGESIVDSAGNGVMMAWEADLMKRTSELLCPTAGLRVLNVGHGMGIIDNFFQSKLPKEHHIIEAHPAVLERMRSNGWYDRPGVTVHEGRWQDVVPKILGQGKLFDAVYFDTFAESYNAFREFFSENMLGLLEEKGRWSFFNGLGADRQICYDVYCKVVELDLFEAAYDTEWESVTVPRLEEVWEGIKRRYWVLPEYRLPVCTFMG